MKTGIEHLSHLVSPKTSGIIWLTDDFLGPSLVGLYELNYLLDGLLTKTLSSDQEKSESKSNFFLAENFGNPFFVGHSVISNKDDLKNLTFSKEITENDLAKKSFAEKFLNSIKSKMYGNK